MSASATLDGDLVRLQFRRPWDTDGHRLFLQAKRLPEARYVFDRAEDSYTVTAPARFAHLVGLILPDSEGRDISMCQALFPVQRWIVSMALAAKRYAIWADCGFGKTPMSLEWARQVSSRTCGRVAFIVPRQLFSQWQDEARKFYGTEVWLQPLRTREEAQAWATGGPGPYGLISHHALVPGVMEGLRQCAGVVLDESSILKGGGGVIKWNLIKSCRGIEYKLSCSATPAPNDTIEYASQASWLEKLRNEGEILWTYFMRDPKTQQWRVRPHAREAFYRFMSSWSIYVRKASAYGFADAHDMPEPEIVEHRLSMTDEQAVEWRLMSQRDGRLLSDDRMGITARAKLSQIAKGFVYVGQAARRIRSEKPALVARLVRDALDEGRQVLVWTVFDEESVVLAELLKDCPDVATLHGCDSQARRAETLEGFRTGHVRALISKARLLGLGMNFQFCTRMIFSGFNDSFESFYQAVRRAHRYGATERLVVHVPYIPDLEAHMWNNLLRKKRQWEDDIAQQEAHYAEALRG